MTDLETKGKRGGTHHDGGQEGRHLPRLDRVVETVLVIVVWFLRSIGI